MKKKPACPSCGKRMDKKNIWIANMPRYWMHGEFFHKYTHWVCKNKKCHWYER
jgi:hypothetical protein